VDIESGRNSNYGNKKCLKQSFLEGEREIEVESGKKINNSRR